MIATKYCVIFLLSCTVVRSLTLVSFWRFTDLCYVFQVDSYLEFEMQQLTPLTEPTYLDYRDIRVRKHEKVRKIFGNVTHHIDMDNSYTATVELFVKQGGEYRKLPYRLKESPVCDFFQQDTYFYEEMTTMTTYPFPFVCPIAKVSA